MVSQSFIAFFVTVCFAFCMDISTVYIPLLFDWVTRGDTNDLRLFDDAIADGH